MVDSIGVAAYSWLRATSSQHRPWQVAVAAACGVLAGSCLTTGPLGVLLLVALFLIPVHYALTVGLAVAVAAAFTLVGPWLTQLGEQSLSQPEVVALVGQVHAVPGLAWLRLNNTLVHGGVMVGLIQFLPTLVVAWWFTLVCRECHDEYSAQTARPRQRGGSSEPLTELQPALPTSAGGAHIEESLRLASTALQALDGEAVDFPGSDLHFRPIAEEPLDVPPVDAQPWDKSEAREGVLQEESAEASRLDGRLADGVVAPGLERLTESRDAGWESRTLDAVLRLEQALESARGGGASGDAHDVVRRAAHLASLVDEMLDMLEVLDPSQVGVVEKPVDTASGQLPQAADPSVLQGYASAQPPRYSAGQVVSTAQDRAPSEGAALKPHDAHPQMAGPNTGEHASLEKVSENEQALRYLLHHLRKIKNRV